MKGGIKMMEQMLKKEYTVCLGDWIVEAENEEMAKETVLGFIEAGEMPVIHLVEENERTYLCEDCQKEGEIEDWGFDDPKDDTCQGCKKIRAIRRSLEKENVESH